MINYRPFIQIGSLLGCLIILGVMLAVKVKTGTLPKSAYGATALAAHMAIFYVFVLLSSFDIFSITAFVNGLFEKDCLSFGTWSSAIRLQTVVELFLMSIIIYRRYAWTQGP